MYLSVNLKLFALAICILVTTVAGIVIKEYSHKKTVEVLTEFNSPVNEILHKMSGKGGETLSANNLSAEKFYLPHEPCECNMDLKQALAPFNVPGLAYLPAYRGGKA
jgi:hypothetical protein